MTKIQTFLAGRTPAQLYEEYLVPGFFKPWAERLAEHAQAGHKCLDLACGTGIVSRALAERFGDNISVQAIDVAPPMIEEAGKRTSSNAIEFQLGSAVNLPFDNGCFDDAFCQQGVQFFPEKEKAFAEVHRVLKPGGKFFVSVWPSAEEANPVFKSFEKAVERHLGADLVPLGPFSFGGEDRLRALAEESGFKVRTLEKQTLNSVLPSIRRLVLFDVLFLGRPDSDGALQPVLAPDDPAGDQIVEAMIADIQHDLTAFIGEDEKLYSPATAMFLIAEK
ncbi:methyltransferase domain-containing protein [Hyphococcus sp.]|uniref:class I SAM-dependent methyltransferase n=1 Tax=Hyphococcus sp. TaxID=2038636 RepID=UPI003CCC14E5